MLVVAVATEVLFGNGINSFSLAIGLGVETGGNLLLDSSKVGKGTGELGGELCTMVRNHGVKATMKVENNIEEQLGNSLRCDIGSGGNVVCHF